MASPTSVKKDLDIRFFFEISPPTLDATANSPLFTLPRNQEPCQYTAEYAGPEPDEEASISPLWAYACKLLLAEAIWQFYRQVRCISWEENHLPDEIYGHNRYQLLSICRIQHFEEPHVIPMEVIIRRDNRPDPCCYTYRYHRYFYCGQWRGWDFDHMEWTVVFNVTKCVPVETYGDAATWIAILPDFYGEAWEWLCLFDSYAPLHLLVDDFREWPHSMRTLSLRLCTLNGADQGLSFEDAEDAPMPYDLARDVKGRKRVIDFSYLEALGPDLDRVVFELKFCDDDDSWEPRTVVLIQEELERVAKYLVGAATNDQSYALKDWVTDSYREDEERKEAQKKNCRIREHELTRY